MNAHDWTLVDDGTFHGFHGSWIAYLKSAVRRLLPPGFYVDSEQHVGRKTADVLALHRSAPADAWPPALSEPAGTLAVKEAPPRTALVKTLSPAGKGGPRSLTIRHARGHRIVALVEIVSPSNKGSERGTEEFVGKAVGAVRAGIHLAVLDLLPPTTSTPDGLLALIEMELSGEAGVMPDGKPLCFSAICALPSPVEYVQPFAAGDPIPGLPLFLTPDRYIDLPLASTYEQAYGDAPPFAQEILSAPSNSA